MATLREAIEQFEARMAVRDFEKDPVRVVTAAGLKTRYWRQDAESFERHGGSLRPGHDQWRCRELAETGELLGIERVGLVVESREGRR
jgi:hypothetical protein